ncbi:MAG: XrtA/PEP-CTERM system-associated ATPase [Candidatus Omnitrophota bacterium]
MYLDFYGLKENPFNVTSDPNFLYLSHTHKEALAHLSYGIEQRKGFVEITGEVGAGKTTICRALLNHLDANVKTSLIFNPSLPETQLLEAVLNDFGIEPKRKSKIAFIRQLNGFLLEQLSKGNNAVLIIDEAQNLRKKTLETIRMLSNLETEKEKLLQIVLVGQPELRDKLNSPDLLQLRQRIGVRFHVRALEKSELKAYIDHRLSVAGAYGSPVFTEEALSNIYEYSKGIPRVVNIICDKSLLLGFVQEVRVIDADIVRRSIDETEGQFSYSEITGEIDKKERQMTRK